MDGVSVVNLSPNPKVTDINKCLEALEQFADWNYHFNLIFKVLKSGVYWKGFEIPEILFDQMRAKESNMGIDINCDIPYFKINSECLIALNQVIRRAQQIERESFNSIEELKAEIKVRDMQIKRVQDQFDDLK